MDCNQLQPDISRIASNYMLATFKYALQGVPKSHLTQGLQTRKVMNCLPNSILKQTITVTLITCTEIQTHTQKLNLNAIISYRKLISRMTSGLGT